MMEEWDTELQSQIRVSLVRYEHLLPSGARCTSGAHGWTIWGCGQGSHRENENKGVGEDRRREEVEPAFRRTPQGKWAAPEGWSGKGGPMDETVISQSMVWAFPAGVVGRG
jgi:hypothetical protein